MSACDERVERPVDRLLFYFAEARGRDSGPQAAIIDGDLKLFYSWSRKSASLFDVSADLREVRDLATQRPEVADRLKQELMDHLRASLGNEMLARLSAGEAEARPRRRNRNRGPLRRARPIRDRFEGPRIQ